MAGQVEDPQVIKGAGHDEVSIQVTPIMPQSSGGESKRTVCGLWQGDGQAQPGRHHPRAGGNPPKRPAMRFSLNTAANAAAWAAVFGLAGCALVVVTILGPFGLILLGLLTLFVCTSMELREDMPSWGAEVFRARLNAAQSPEQRAAQQEEKTQWLSPLRFYRWCGITLLIAGIAGFVWQQLQ